MSRMFAPGQAMRPRQYPQHTDPYRKERSSADSWFSPRGRNIDQTIASNTPCRHSPNVLDRRMSESPARITISRARAISRSGAKTPAPSTGDKSSGPRKASWGWTWASGRASARRWNFVTRCPDPLHNQSRHGERKLRRRVQLGIEIGDDVFERRNGLLNCRDLHQFPAVDRSIALLQRHDQIPALLLELHQR